MTFKLSKRSLGKLAGRGRETYRNCKTGNNGYKD
jgi:hypothetical protein